MKRTVALVLAATAALGLAGCGSHDSSLVSRESHAASGHETPSESPTSAETPSESPTSAETPSESPTSTETPSASATTNPGIAIGDHADAARSNDIRFAQMMIPHHEQALVLAELALTGHGASDKVRALATRIKNEQAPEVAQMKGWLTQWKAPEDMGHEMTMPGLLTADQVKALAATQGTAFDRLWLQDMRAHHQGAVTMAQAVVKTTQTADVKTFAEGVIAAQTKEIAEITALLG